MSGALACGVVALYCLASFGVGLQLQRWLSWPDPQPTQPLALSASAFLLGQGALMSLWVLLGLAGWLNTSVTGVVILACAALAFLTGRELLRLVWNEVLVGLHWLAHVDWPFRAVCGLLFLALALFLLAAGLRGPLGDAEAFYLTYPKVIAASERLGVMPGPYAPFSQIGLVAELHFAALILLGGISAAKLFVWPVALATGVMLMAIGTSAGLGQRGRWILFIMLMTSTGFTNHIWDGKVDVFAAALGLAAVYWILAAGPTGKMGLPCAGLLAGFASVAKFSYIPSLLPGAALLLAWRSWNQQGTSLVRTRNVLNSAVVFFLWWAVAWIPHMLKNGMLFDAPFAPFIGGDSSWLNQVWFSPQDTLWIVATYPFALTFGRYPLQSGNVSLLLVALLPLALFLPKPRSLLHSTLAQVTIAGLVGVLLWMVFRPSVIAPRYIFASIALLFPLAAHAAEYAYEKENSPRWLREAILVCFVSALVIVSRPNWKMPAWAYQAMRSNLPECTLAVPYCKPLTAFNATALPGERVYFAGYYAFWLRADVLQCQATGLEIERVNMASDPASRWDYLAKRGFHYVIVDKTTHAKALQVFNPSGAPPALKVSAALETPELLVLRIGAPENQRPFQASCIQRHAPAWDIVDVK